MDHRPSDVPKERGRGTRLRTLACLVTLLTAAESRAGIVVDATSQASVDSSATLTWSHTVGAASKRLLIVGVSNRAGKTVTSVTYGGTALTQAGFQLGPGNQNRADIWYLVAPPPGPANIVVTLAAAVDIVGGAVSFGGVNQTAPLGTFVGANGTSFTPAVTVSSAPNEVVVDSLSTNGDAISAAAGAGQTLQWNTATGTPGGDVRGAGSTAPGASSVTMSWTLGASKPWSIGAVPLKPARRVAILQ